MCRSILRPSRQNVSPEPLPTAFPLRRRTRRPLEESPLKSVELKPRPPDCGKLEFSTRRQRAGDASEINPDHRERGAQQWADAADRVGLHVREAAQARPPPHRKERCHAEGDAGEEGQARRAEEVQGRVQAHELGRRREPHEDDEGRRGVGRENGRGAQRRGTGRARGCRVANAPERIERLEQAAKLAASIAEIKRAEAGEKKKKQVDAASSLVTHAPTAAAKLEKKGGDVLKLTIKDIRALLVVAYGEESPATISKSAAVTTFSDAIKADPLGLAKIDKVAKIKDSTPLIPVDAEQGGTPPGALDDDDDDDDDDDEEASVRALRVRREVMRIVFASVNECAWYDVSGRLGRTESARVRKRDARRGGQSRRASVFFMR